MLQGFGFCLARSVEFDVDALKHGIQICRDLRIPKPHDAISLALKPLLSVAITLGRIIFIVMSAVDFQDEALGWAKKVNDIRTDRRLPAEVRAVDWKLFEGTPQHSLMRSRIRP